MRGRLWTGLVLLALACSGSSQDGSGVDATLEPAAGSGTEPGAGSGTEPGAGSGTEPGAGSGTEPGAGSGTEPGAGSGTEPGAGSGTEPGVVPQRLEASLDEVLISLAEVRGIDRAGLKTRFSVKATDELGYAPRDAQWLDLIQSSALGLNEAELAVLNQHGFVISDRQSFPDFTYGYKTIYFEDLPVYVSLDSILYALHRSYDTLLLSVEEQALIPTLTKLLQSLRGRVAAAGLPANTAADVEFFLDVAWGLLSGEAVTAPGAAEFVRKAEAASGAEDTELFGELRLLDFSQFEPRGHYTDYRALQRYFRAMMWLGRVDFRLIETQPDGRRELRRREIEGMLGLASLFDETDRGQWDAIAETMAVFVGEPDSMMLPDVASFLADLGISRVDELTAVSDAELEAILEAGRYGVQRISSHMMVTLDVVATLPLNTSFSFLGQRYVIDSHVFSNVVYDRVPPTTSPLRLMPNPLDVAFAALGNNQAATLLASELDTYGYAQQLAETRVLADAHESAYWDSSLYTLWLGALRAISPGGDADNEGLPSVARSEAWGRRLLNTQLASWAELRHDTLLYAKQSYTGIPACEYPDAYVDPYPEAFARIVRLADKGAAALRGLPIAAGSTMLDTALAYLDNLAEVGGMLQGMAEHQRTGTPHSQEQLDFINQAVAIEDRSVGCAVVPQPVGWYPRLFLNPDDALNADPTIADVHTQPADEDGNLVGRVLHVGTGGPRLMVVTVESCGGPRAYAGLASAYFERVTEDFERLTDEEWATELDGATPADVPWMRDLVVR